MVQQIPVDPAARADDPRADAERDDATHEVLPDLAYQRHRIANVAYIGRPGEPGWVLVDAGFPGTRARIEAAAEARFGGARPAAILLTHGHFDHVGVLEDLVRAWDVPVYAHRLERPYLDGSAAYPPGDASVGGGAMALASPLFPTKPVNVSAHLRDLPEDGSVPGLPGWRWIHTPGHSPGHVSFWRDSDRTVIAGDAFITTASESAYESVMQTPEIHGPPKYLTLDWPAARDSVRALAALKPDLAITGHGRALTGPELRRGLEALAADFDRIAVPDQGRYVERPNRAEDGSAYREP
jgi:glyoxylase-like metal-dependent hydrolase (beta-lactamase superfamily II)